MAYLQKDRSVLRHRAYYTVHAGNDRTGRILASIQKLPGHGSHWGTRIRNAWTKNMDEDLAFPSFAEAKDYAMRQANILEG